MKPRPTILIVKNRAMGDAVIGLATIQYLRTLFPKGRLIYVVPSWVAPLFSQVETDADKIYPLQLKNWRDWFQHYKQLRRLKPDFVFEMFQRGRTKFFFRFFPCPYFFHNHHTKKGKIHDQGIIKSNIQRDLDGAWTYFSDKEGKGLPSYLDFTPQMKCFAKKENLITLGVVATRETKIWPLPHYLQLCLFIQRDCPGIKIQIPLSASERDQKIKQYFLKFNLSPQIYFVEVPLPELPQKLAASKIYLGNDTGLKHICVALGIRTWTFFGPEPPREWHPYSRSEHPYFYREELECRTRKAHFCGLSSCETMDCLKNFTPELVWKALKKEIVAIAQEK